MSGRKKKDFNRQNPAFVGEFYDFYGSFSRVKSYSGKAQLQSLLLPLKSHGFFSGWHPNFFGVCMCLSPGLFCPQKDPSPVFFLRQVSTLRLRRISQLSRAQQLTITAGHLSCGPVAYPAYPKISLPWLSKYLRTWRERERWMLIYIYT